MIDQIKMQSLSEGPVDYSRRVDCLYTKGAANSMTSFRPRYKGKLSFVLLGDASSEPQHRVVWCG